MITFEAKPVFAEEKLGNILKKTREIKKKKISEAALALNINQKYLKSLEEGEYKSLPSGIYGLNYLREYCGYLGIDYKKVVKKFEIERSIYFQHVKPGVYERQVVDRKLFLVTPRIIKNSLLAIVALIASIYLIFLLANIYLPPKLEITNPVKNIATTNNKILIAGITEKESQVFVNDLPVSVSADGNFSLNINLKKGVNKIIISAQKKNKKKQLIIREILLKDSQN